ncbi:hypothetical protein SNE40_013118 [Patella caerulea]|uniref:Zinc finger DNA binding protein n=1 Tax=Patella caerulea TaxID=87958 RepID=A0AAN8PKP1_PATCE
MSKQTAPNKPSVKRVHVSSSSGDEVFGTDLAQIHNLLASIQEQLKSVVTRTNLDESLRISLENIRSDICKEIKAEISVEITELKTTLSEEKEKVQALVLERDQLKSEMLSLATNQQRMENGIKDSIKLGNRNEQYSRKKNIKVLGVIEKDGENLRADFKKISFEYAGVRLNDTQIVAIHRLPSNNSDYPRPIIVKLLQSDVKIALMRKRQKFKVKGILLFEDITKRNTQLINRLKNHNSIDSAWVFNGSVHAKTYQDERLSFDLFDNITDKVNLHRTNQHD